nr:AP-3 complex subunit beta-2-like [Columba livia]
MAFKEVCPERIDLTHKNYRKLCNLLIDVEEWGQVVIINMLTRYARTQFLSPNQNESLLEESTEKAFYGSEEEDAKDAKAEAAPLAKRKPYVMDPDHRLLLRNTKPLLQSRNAAVVMAVAQLYFHLAPKAEVGVIAKALVRLLRSHRSVAPSCGCPLPHHPMGWPRTLGETPKMPIPLGTSCWGELPKKEGFLVQAHPDMG